MKKIIPIIIAVLVLGLIWYCSNQSQKVLTDGLPPQASFATMSDAYYAALADTKGDLKRLGSVLGTGSMAPYIPPSAPGLDPYATVVAFTLKKKATYEDIQHGDLCVYEPANAPGESWIHQAAEKDSDGWIMTGLNNRRSENWMRMTAKNFRFVVEKTYVWPQPTNR